MLHALLPKDSPEPTFLVYDGFDSDNPIKRRRHTRSEGEQSLTIDSSNSNDSLDDDTDPASDFSKSCAKNRGQIRSNAKALQVSRTRRLAMTHSQQSEDSHL